MVPPRRRARAPTPPSPSAAALLERKNRALEEPLDVQLRSADPYPLLEVRNPLHGTAYLVMLPGFPAADVALCTCTDFARRGLGTCKHIEAGTRWLREHPGARPLRPRPPAAPSSRFWTEVDRRSRNAASEPDLVRRARASGAALFEEG
jgi:hypothetical protein